MPATGSPRVSIIIVNYNGAAYLDNCLSSLERQTLPQGSWEAILVDNGSHDGSLELVRQKFPWVRLVSLPDNVGFARGNNEGIRQARGELIALLNNDTVVEPRWLEALVEELDRNPRCGGTTSKIVFREHPDTINSAGLNLYCDGLGGDRGFRQRDEGQYEEPAEVFGGCGASVLLRRAMLEDIGLLDERFFMYYEDLDLAWRGHLRGWRFRYTPRSIVHHVHCGTSGEWSPFFLYHVERNRVFVSLKNAPPALAARALVVFTARAALKWLRVLTLQDRTRLDRQQAWAYVPAGLSLVTHMPAMLWQRWRIRVRRRTVPDRAFAYLVTPRRREKFLSTASAPCQMVSGC